MLCLLLSMVILLVLIVDLIRRSWSVWSERPVDFLTSGPELAERGGGRRVAGIKGTLILMFVVAVVAFPLGIACAVYLEEYSSRSRFAKWTRINVRNLAGVPSIVYGLLGSGDLREALSGVTSGKTVFAGGLTLAALVLPIVIITASEALRAVPRQHS